MEQGAKSMERTDGGTDASDFPTSSLPPPSDGRRFRALVRREPLLALAVAGLFALAVETAQKPQDFSEPLTSGAILPAFAQFDTPLLPYSPTPLLPGSYPVGEAALAQLLYGEPPVTNRWDAHAQRVLDTYGDTDGDGLADAEETTGLALLDIEDGQSLHAFGPDARVLRFPTAADHDCRLLPLPFSFPLGEHDFTNVYVHVDGVLGFGHPGLPEHPAAPPFAVRVPPGHPSAWLAPFWADMAIDPALGTALDPGRGRVWTLPLADPATGATNGCVVAWEGLRVGTNSASSASFQVELRADGLARILHGTFEGVEDPGALAVVGVWNAAGGWAYSAFGSGLVVPGRALRLWATAQTDPGLREWFKDASDPADPDTDGDGTPDGVEWFFSVPRADGRTLTRVPWHPDPLDYDNDGLANRREYDLGLDALWYDTDGDSLPDGWEYEHGLDPLSDSGSDGASGDPDSDGRDNFDEFRHQTLPKEADAPPPVPDDAVWVTLELEGAPYWQGSWLPVLDDPRLLTLRGTGPESGRAYALHDPDAAGRVSWTVPLSPRSEYVLGTTVYAPWAPDRTAVDQWTFSALRASGTGYFAVFGPGLVLDEAEDVAGPAFRSGPAPRGMPAGMPSSGAVLVAVCGDGTQTVVLHGGNDRDVLLDAGCTSTNVGGAVYVPAPYCGADVEWSCDAPPGVEGGSDLGTLPWGGQCTNATLVAGWRVRTGTHGLTGRSKHGCGSADGEPAIDSVTRIGLDVTGADGKGGPDGDLDDAGDSLSGYLPGEVPGGPVIRWDSTENRLVPQRLSLRVETQGPVPYTGVVFRIAGVTSTPGWCTNTREPGTNDSPEVHANWDPNDFSLSETGYLAETNVVFEGSSASVDLFCRDYGGSCIATVILNGTNNLSVRRSFTIPVDSDNDNLADRWEADAALGWSDVFGTNATESATALFGAHGVDEPADPDGPGERAAHAAEGDGLTPRQEYRGFSLPGSARGHVRLSPIRKEVVAQATVATVAGTSVSVPGGVAAAMEYAREVFGRDLGIDLVWSVGPPAERLPYERLGAAASARAHSAEGAAVHPPLHWSPDPCRRIVFSANVPAAAGSTRPLGIAWRGSRVAAVDAARVQGAVESFGSPMRTFYARHGISAADALASVLVHEAGHLVGCPGDERIPEDEPSLMVRSRYDWPGRWELSVKNSNGKSYLQLAHAGMEPERFEVLGGGLVTLSGLAQDINAGAAFHAVVRTSAFARDASGLILLPAGSNTVSYASSTNVWHAAPLEAVVNGVMTYNDSCPALWKTPAFDNAASTNAAGPLQRLFRIEVGTVDVR